MKVILAPSLLVLLLALGTAVARNVGKESKRGPLLWQEEFDSLNKNTWKHLITGWRGGNNEFQYYRNQSKNSYVRDGILYIKPTLTADEFGESFLEKGEIDLNNQGCNVNTDGGCIIKAGVDIVNPIQSARMVTEDSFSFTYGTVEVRAKMPAGDWLWPAIWLLPTDWKYGEWPRSGEIDITEVKGNKDFSCNGVSQGRELHGSTLHWGPRYDQNAWYKTHWEKRNTSSDYTSAFHVYTLEWLASGFKFSVDDIEIGTLPTPAEGFWKFGGFQGNDIWANGTKMAPFDQRFHFILNVAVGGNFFGDGCTNNPYNKPWSSSDADQMRKFWSKKNEWYPTWNAATEDNAMQVDYIRVYKPA